jgi:predicted RNase H-like HicB family nuclease
MKYTIVLEEGLDGGWSATAPDLPGLLLMGDTRDELLASAPEGIRAYIESARELGMPIPAPGAALAQVEVSA